MSKRKAIVGPIALVTLLIAAVGALMAGGGLGAAAAASVRAPLASSAGCGKAPALSSGNQNIQSSGQNRSYIIRLPANYDTNHPYRLVFGFHWVGGTANDVDSGGTDGYNWSYYGLRRLADAAGNGTIFVAPQGNGNGWGNPNGQDITFVDDMLRTFETGLCIDTTQIFSSGFSYGGAMTYALACARPTTFRAVAVYSGANLSGCTPGTGAEAYIGLHGLRDGTLPIADGRALRDTFVRNNQCTPQNPPEPAYGSLTHIVTAYTGCLPDKPVLWAAFDGAGHDPGPIDGSTGDGWHTWTSGVVWNFFSQFASSNGSPSATASTSTSASASASASPSASASASPSSSPSGPPPPGACNAAYQTVSSWQGGFQGQVTVTAGSAAISSWTVRWTLASGQTITQVWSGTLTTSGSSVRVANASYNGSLQPSGTTTFGFLANGTPSTPTLSCTSP